MSINKLRMERQTPFTKDDLLPASLIQSEEDIKKWEEKGYPELILFSIIEKACEENGVDANCFYFTKSSIMNQYVYWNFPNLLEFHHSEFTMDTTNLNENFSMWARIKKRDEALQKLVKEKDYGAIFVFAGEKALFLVFDELKKEIPKEEWYKTLIDIYVHNDYGTILLSPSFFREAVKYRGKGYEGNIKERLTEVIKNGEAEINDGMLTIYRGQGTESTRHDKAKSWTINPTIAFWFATRSSVDGEVIKGQIPVDKVIDFIDDRNESEIIAFPEDIVNTKKMQQLPPMETLKKLIKEEYIEEFHLYKNTFVTDDMVSDNGNVHGKGHIYRVLLNCLCLSRSLSLSLHDRALLSMVSCIHDIGRENDEEDDRHGEYSWSKFIDDSYMGPAVINVVNRKDKSKNYELEYFTPEEAEILEFIVVYHCIDDETAKKVLFSRTDEADIEWTDKLKARTWRLYELFKDADALDRIRFKDLDEKYLRNAKSKQQILFASSIANNMSALGLNPQ